MTVVDGGNLPLAPAVPTNTSGDFVLAGVPFADLTVRAVCAGSTVEQHIQPAALDLSGFSPTDLAWTNHSPQAISITAQSGGMIVDTFQPGATLQLSAQVDDADNDPLTYQWRVDDPSDVLVANGSNATLHLSDRPGQHGVALSAHDALGGWDAIKLINPCLTVSPVPNPNIFPERAKNPMFQSLIPPWDGYPSSIFLTRKGTGTAQDACTYYNLIDPACDDLNCDGVPDGNAFAQPCKRITLGGWWEVNGFNPLDGSGADVTRAFYENHNDLGFGREMNCRKATNGNVACFVSNYGEGDQNPNNVKLAVAANPICAKATVAMEYSPVDFYEGLGPQVKFYVYKGRSPTSPRLYGADLDHFGTKFVPNLCLNCHGGNANLPPSVPALQMGNGFFGIFQLIVAYLTRMGDLQNYFASPSSFLPFDLPTFVYAASLPQSAQESNFKQLNLWVKGTNPTAGITDLVNGWYAGNSPVQIPGYVPSGWTTPAAATTMYNTVVATSCRTCHVAHGLDFTDYSQLQFFDFSNVCGMYKAMPHAYITYKNFWLSSPSRPAYLAGLAQVGGLCQ